MFLQLLDLFDEFLVFLLLREFVQMLISLLERAESVDFFVAFVNHFTHHY